MSDHGITKNTSTAHARVIHMPPIHLAALEDSASKDADRSEPADRNPFVQTKKWETAPTLDAVEAGRSVVRAGHSGRSIEALQGKLNQHAEAAGLTPTAIDGYFGADTQRLVREIQEAYGLRVDGIAGQKTLRQIQHLDLIELENSAGFQALDEAVREQALALLEELSAHGSWSQHQTVLRVLEDGNFARLDRAVQSQALHRLYGAAAGGKSGELEFVAGLATDAAFASLASEPQNTLLQRDPKSILRGP